MTGENNWEKSVIEGEVPHDADLSDTAKTIEKDKDSDKIATVEEKFFSSVYKRWKPNLDK